jgi:hypothetical protein
MPSLSSPLKGEEAKSENVSKYQNAIGLEMQTVSGGRAHDLPFLPRAR